MQIQLLNLNVFINVVFSIIGSDAPSVLSNRDMITNGFDKIRHGIYRYIHTWPPPTTRDLKLLLRIPMDGRNNSIGALYVNGAPNHSSKLWTPNGELFPQLDEESKQGDGIGYKKNGKKYRRKYRICKNNSSAPRRFNLRVGSDDLQFNHRVAVNTIFICSRPILHIIDENTHFSEAFLLKSQ